MMRFKSGLIFGTTMLSSETNVLSFYVGKTIVVIIVYANKL